MVRASEAWEEIVGPSRSDLRINREIGRRLGSEVFTETYGNTLALERTLAILPKEFPGRLELSYPQQLDILERIEDTGYEVKDFRSMAPGKREAYIIELWLTVRHEASKRCPQFLSVFDEGRKNL